jgi:PKD repeat protein
MKRRMLTTLLVSLTLCSWASGSPVVESSWPICTHYSMKAFPRVSEQWAVWWDMRDGYQLWGYDFLTEQEFFIANGAGSVTSPDIEGNLVVWATKDGEAGVWGAYLGPPETPGGQPTVDIFQISEFGWDCALSGDLVVWSQLIEIEPWVWDITLYGYDLVTQETSVLWETVGDICYMEADGEAIVYVRYPWNEFSRQVCLYHMGTGEETVLQESGTGYVQNPSVAGDYVAWSVRGSDWVEVYLHDIDAAETDVVGSGELPSVGADCVVWSSPPDDMGVYHYDLETGETTCLLPTEWEVDNVDVCGNRIVWRAHCGDGTLDTIYCLVYIPDVRADFSAAPTAGPAPLTVDFTDLSTGDPTSWEWDFGDGATSTEQNPSHDYTAIGSYTVTLTATGAGGSDTETKADCVQVLLPPTADFSASPTNGIAPLGVSFTDLSTSDPTAWEWDFGDGGMSTEQNPSHEYLAPGSYSVSLTASNAGGADTETKADYITVVPPPPAADFSAAPTSGPAPLEVAFTGLSSNEPTSWSWDFGDGDTSTTQNPSHAYLTPGCYTVSLTAANAGGADTDTKTGYIVVTFADIPLDDWACDAILACVNAGIVSGYEDGSYHPEIAVTRDQMAVFISRAMAGGDENVPAGPGTATFDDVPAGYWAYDYVEYCVANDVVQGYSPVTYGPTDLVARDAMAVFISRAVAGGDAGVPDGPAEATFDDVPTDYWSYKYIEYCAGEEIVQGYDPVTYGPTGLVTRDQMAVFIARAYGLTG